MKNRVMLRTKLMYFILFVVFFGLFLLVYYYGNWESKFVISCFYPINLCFLLWSINNYSRRKKYYVAIAAIFMYLFFWKKIDDLIDISSLIPFASAAIALLISYIVDRKGKDIKSE